MDEIGLEALPVTNYWQDVIRLFTKNRIAVIGLTMMIIIVVLCAGAPLFTSHDPITEMNFAELLFRPGQGGHILGTDDLGRDIWTRLLYGGRYSLLIGFATSFFAIILEIIIGSIAGYFGGKVETFIMRFMDIWQVLPGTLLAIMVSAALGSGFFNTLLAISLGQIPAGVRLIRGQILSETGREYIEAAESINCSKISIMFKHLLPNVISPMIVKFTMGVGQNITSAAGLSFIGLGVQPPTAEWGAMLSGARQYIMSYPMLIAIPGIAIALVILGTNLLGDGLRDALDPKLRN